MIVFLTLCYVAVLALAVKFGLIKLNLWWKISPLAWMLLLFIVLFLPMQWGAPGGSVTVIQYVVEIVPNVSGEVVDVPVKPLTPLEPGDVLFQIDPVPFQAEVDRLEADLAAAIQNVEQLRALSDAAAAEVTKATEEVDIKGAAIEAAAANVVVATTAVEEASARLEKATALVTDLTVQVEAGKREFDRQKLLLSKDAGSESDRDRAEVNYTGLVAQLNTAQADLRGAEENVTGSRASLDAEKANERSARLQLKQLVDAELPRAKAVAREAKLAAESMIDGEHTSVATVRAQLATARFNLDQTTVRAPTRGHVAFVTLRPGQRVASFPMRSWMAFIDHEKTEIVTTIDQYALRHVEPGQSAEVTFKLYPGKVVPAKVDRIAYITSAGQLQPSGEIVSTADPKPLEPFAVALKIEEMSFDDLKMAGGAKGSAAIYTESMKATHVIRRIMIRMDAWMNYLIP